MPEVRTVDLDAGLGDAADHDAFEAALTGAVGAGAPGERALLAALAATSDEERFCGLVAALGEADGPDGSAVLGDIALRPGMSAAVRLCALIALAKRAGVAATDVYARALADPDDEVRGDALLALASAGDDRAQRLVLAELRRRLEVRSRIPLFDMDERALSFQSKILSAVCYLGRHAAERRGTAAGRDRGGPAALGSPVRCGATLADHVLARLRPGAPGRLQPAGPDVAGRLGQLATVQRTLRVVKDCRGGIPVLPP
nr:hypothetical protein GCM10020092_061050 [Actinoplanes digitatis]